MGQIKRPYKKSTTSSEWNRSFDHVPVTTLETQAAIALEKEIAYWNEHIFESYAMLPGVMRELIKQGKLVMNKELYDSLNQYLFRPLIPYMNQAFSKIKDKIKHWHPHDLEYHHWGGGHLHDLELIFLAWRMGFRPKLWDISDVVLKSAKEAIESHPKIKGFPPANDVVQFGELTRYCTVKNEDKLDPHQTAILGIFRLIHHKQSKERQITLRGMGEMLRPREEGSVPGDRAIVIGIAFAENNPRYPYKTSEPIYKKELQECFSGGAGCEVKLEDEILVDYCKGYPGHQVYSFLTAVAAG